MNVNEGNFKPAACQIAGTPLGSKTLFILRRRQHVAVLKRFFPHRVNIAAAVNVKERLIPAVKALRDAIAAKATEWKDLVKIGRHAMQDATRSRSARNGRARGDA